MRVSPSDGTEYLFKLNNLADRPFKREHLVVFYDEPTKKPSKFLNL